MFWLYVQLLKFNDYRVRQRAIRWMAASSDDRAIDPVTNALHDRNYLVRKAAAQALGNIGREEALGPLIDIAEDSLQYSMTKSAVGALSKVLNRIVSSADAQDLEQAAILSDFRGFFRKSAIGANYFIETGKAIPWTIDCSLIRETASKELIRRGLSAERPI